MRNENDINFFLIFDKNLSLQQPNLTENGKAALYQLVGHTN
jgi:hypothetical protein